MNKRVLLTASATTCSAVGRETTQKSRVSPKHVRSRGKFWAVLMGICLSITGVLGQSASSGKFIVVRNGTTTGTYDDWQTAVYQSSTTGNIVSQVKNDQGQTIYEQNKSNPKYWMFQQNPYPSYSSYSATDASNFINSYPVTNAIVFYGNGTVYGARTTGKSTIHKANEGLETSATYVSKQSVLLPSNFSSMTATIDLSQCIAIQNSNYPENLYIIGYFGYETRAANDPEHPWVEFMEIGFQRTSNYWQLYVHSLIDGKEFHHIQGKSITGNEPVNLEWRFENGYFSIYKNGQFFHEERFTNNENYVRQNKPRFHLGISMCPGYTNNSSDSISNFRDRAFFGPVKLQNCKIHFTDGNWWNFWEEDTDKAIYCNQQTAQVVRQGNSEIITLSRTGSFSSTCNITTSSSPSSGGTTSGGGNKTLGTSCTVTASANSGYTFSNWTENGTVVSTSASYRFTVESDRNLVANFIQNTVIPPSNDNCSSAISLSCGSTVSGTLAGATATPTTSVSYSQGGNRNDVFYKFTTTNAGTYTVTLTKSNSSDDIDLGLHSSCSATSELTNLTANGTTETMSYNCSASTTYIVRVTDWREDGTSSSSFTIKVDCPTTGTCVDIPNYDDSITPSTSWNTATSRSIASEGCHIYRFAATAGDYYSFKTGCDDGATADFDTYLEIYNASGTRLTYNDDNSTCGSNRSYIENWQCPTGGGTYYYLKVRGYNANAYGTYTLAYKKTIGGMTLENLSVSPSSVNTLSSSFTVTFTSLGNRNDSPISFQGGFALYNSSGTTEIGYSPNSYSYTNLPAYNGWWQDLTQNLTLSDFGLTTMLAQGTYRLYYTYSTNMSSPHTPYIICRKPDGSALYATITITAPPTYTVTLNKQNGTGGTSSVTATYGQAMPIATAPTRTGYTFDGYYIGTNGSGTQYYTASMASARDWNLTSNTTLYAKWTANTNGIEEVQAAGISIFPNPAKDELFIKSELPIKRVEIYSLIGSLLLQENNFNEKISVSALPKGVLLMKVYTEKGTVINKIVKE
jgi:uncharacterized repeat protein (TIGR02543 family)